MKREHLLPGLLVVLVATVLGVLRFIFGASRDILDIIDIAITTGVFLAIYMQTMSLMQQTNIALIQHYKPLAQEMYCKLEDIEKTLDMAAENLEHGLYDKLKAATIRPAALSRLRLLPGINKELVEEIEQLAREYTRLLAKTRRNPTKTRKKKLADLIDRLTVNLQLLKDHIKYAYALKQEELSCPHTIKIA